MRNSSANYLIALALLLSLGATAQAKRVVAVEADRPDIAAAAISTDTLGAARERDLFVAGSPSAPGACRLPLDIFDKTRLARVCN